MSTNEDKSLARVILKKGWTSKEILEEALREVAKVREIDDQMTLARYLALKEVLTWDQIHWALDVVKAKEAGMATPASPSDTPASRPRATVTPRVRPRRPNVASSKHEPARGGSRGSPQPQISSVAVIFGAVIVVLVGALLYVAVLRPKGNTQPSVPGGLAKGNTEAEGGVVPPGSGSHISTPRPVSGTRSGTQESLAEKKLRQVEAQADLYKDDHNYSGLIARYQSIIRDFPNTPTAEAAQLKIATTKDAWSKAAIEKWNRLIQFARDEQFNAALTVGLDLREWCPPDPPEFESRLVRKIMALQRDIDRVKGKLVPVIPDRPELKGPEIARGPDEPEEPAEEPKVESTNVQPVGPDQPPTEPDPVTPPPEKVVPNPTINKGKLLSGEEEMPDFTGEDNVVLKLIEKHGIEEVQRKLSAFFRGARVAVSRTGRVRLGYDFSPLETHAALDWSPTPGKRQRDKVRWTLGSEVRTYRSGSYYYYFYGIRISEDGRFFCNPVFADHIKVEACCCLIQPPKAKTHLIMGVYDKRQRVWYGTDLGVQAVKFGRGTDANPRRRSNVPTVARVHWLCMEYRDGCALSFLGYERPQTRTTSSGTTYVSYRPVYWDIQPIYAATGALPVKKPLTEMRAEFLFRSKLFAAIAFVRITGFVNAKWFREEAKKRRVPLGL